MRLHDWARSSANGLDIDSNLKAIYQEIWTDSFLNWFS